MSAPATPKVTFSPSAPARKASRYTLGAHVALGRADDGTDNGRVGIGSDKNGTSLVYEIGHAQTGVPLFAVATAIASGKVIPMDALVGAFVTTGTLSQLAKAVEKAQSQAS
jgi:hypothetical protein